MWTCRHSRASFRCRKHFVASRRKVLKVLSLTGVADVDPGDLVGVAHAPHLRVPLNALQHGNQAAEPHPDRIGERQVPAITSSPDTDEAASVVTSPSPVVLERLGQDQRSSFLRLAHSTTLREIGLDLHDPGWTPSTIGQLGDVLCEFADVFSTSNTDFGSCSLMPFSRSRSRRAVLRSLPGPIAQTLYWPKKWTRPSTSTLRLD